MQVLLQISSGKSNVRNVRLKSDTVIGRSPECQLKVASNQISRRHCQIVIRDNIVAIKDLGSANGTFVNGRQIPPEVEIPLTPGTRVMLGPLQFTVEYELPGMPVPVAAPAKSPAKVAATASNPPAPVTESEPNYDTVTAPLPFIPPPIPALPAMPAPAMMAPVAAAQPSPPPVEEVEPEGIPDFSEAGLPTLTAGTPADPDSPATVIASSPFHDFQPPEAFSNVAAEGARDDHVDPGNFNFGIFAASGSGIIVESSDEIPIPAGLTTPEATGPASAKPPKKGLLEMFGWGKKKPPLTASEPAPHPVAEPQPQAAAPQPVDAGETLTFQVPAEPESEASADDDPLQNFFNNFK